MSEDDADSFGMFGMFGDPEDDLESSDDGTEPAPPGALDYETDSGCQAQRGRVQECQ